MEISNAYAGLAVDDLSVAAAWYEQLLGPGEHTMDELMEWHLPAGGGIQVFVGPDRSGQGSCTLVVDDIDDVAERLRALDLEAQPVSTDAVDTLMIKDPDGNSIAFAAPRTPASTR